MNRKPGRSLPRASTATALLALLGACSQPASYATVDLSGSFPQAGGHAAYSGAGSGPVYRSTQAYTYAAPTYAAPGQQYAAAPVSPDYTTQPYSAPLYSQYPQVASIDPTLGYESIGTLNTYQSDPYAVTDSGTLRTDAVLDPNAYIDTGPLQEPLLAQQTAPTPPSYETTMLGGGSIDGRALPQPSYEYEYTPTDPLPQPAPSRVETEPLPPLPASPVDPMPVATPSLPEASPDYTVLTEEPSAPDYEDFRRESEAESPTEVRFPSPIAPVAPVDPAPAAPLKQAPVIGPSPDAGYPRPYEFLRPGVFPAPSGPATGEDALTALPQESWTELAALDPVTEEADVAQNVGWIVEEPAPVTVAEAMPPVPAPFASAPVAEDQGATLPALAITRIANMPPPRQQTAEATSRLRAPAQTHTIAKGETLYRIARQNGITPEELAVANGLTLDSVIYPGQQLIIPMRIAGGEDSLNDAPVVILRSAQGSQTYAPAPRVDVSLQQDVPMGGPGAVLPVITPEFHATLQPQPQQMSRPAFGWPVHGQVYRLSAGQVEIAAAPGKRVTASAPGRVTGVEHGSLGTLVMITHDGGWRSFTFGLQYSDVVVGQPVDHSTVLGPVGGTGRIQYELRDGASNIAEALNLLREG